jgi:glycerol kinase
MKYLLALDQGTSSSRSIVFDLQGNIVALAQEEFRQIYPQPGWVEHDPEEIWASQLATARRVLAEHDIRLADIAGLGITNQRETTVVWDRRTGRPIHHAIVWQDRRSESICAALREQGAEPEIRQRTGLIVDAYFSGTKIRWILDNVAGARALAEDGLLAFGTVDSWLIWKLTGGRLHVTDVTNASRTMLYNIRSGEWDDTLLQLIGVPRSMLPQVHPSSHVYGETDPHHLGASLRIGGIAGDQQAALFGQACFAEGQVKNTYGTGCFMLMNTGAKAETSAHGLLTTRAAQAAGPAVFAREGSVFVGGAVVQWMRDGLRAIASSSEVEALAQRAPDSGGVVVVPAFTGLGAPYWNAEARGTITGLTRGTTLAHIARAALESIAFQSAALLEAMQKDLLATGGAPVTELRVDGGAAANDLLMQFQADLLGIPVLRPRVTETTALGAAYLAGLAVGVWSGTSELAAQWRIERTFHPTLSRAAAQARMAEWDHAVRQTVAA